MWIDNVDECISLFQKQYRQEVTCCCSKIFVSMFQEMLFKYYKQNDIPVTRGLFYTPQ